MLVKLLYRLNLIEVSFIYNDEHIESRYYLRILNKKVLLGTGKLKAYLFYGGNYEKES